MFQTTWERHVASFKERQVAARHALSGIESKIDNLVSRIVATSQPTLIGAYEGELKKLERRRIAMSEKIDSAGILMPDFEETYSTAISVISNPLILWQNQDVRLKRAAVRYAFTSRPQYDRENGYSSAKASLPFQLLQSLSPSNKENVMKMETVVGDTGIEPVTPAV